MKTKFKYFLLYSMSCIGVLSLLSSVSGNISNKQQNEVGTYQIAVSSDQNALFRLNTSTGKIVRIKKSNIKKIVKPLSGITLFVLIVCVIYEIVKLFRGNGDVTDVIGLICITIFLFVILPLFVKKKSKP